MTLPARREGDLLPGPADMSAAPLAGATRALLRVGPTTHDLRGLDGSLVDSLGRWAGPDVDPHPVGGPVAVPGAVLELRRSSRAGMAPAQAGHRARVVTWLSGSVFALATHDVAVHLDPVALRGTVLLGEGTDGAALDRALQNAVRAVTTWMLAIRRDGLLVHASAVVDGDGAHVFVGPSGAGKTTIVRHSAARSVLADDIAILARSAGRWSVFPSPLWAEPARRRPRAERSVPLAGMYQLAHEPAPSRIGLGPATAAALVAGHVPFVSGLGLDDAVLGVVAELVAEVPAHRLGFAPDSSFWNLLSLAPSRESASS